MSLPQLTGRPFLTDAGLETTLVFTHGLELPYFAAFPLVESAYGERLLRDYYGAYAALAARFECGLILESATWRASADWGRKLGYHYRALAGVNRRAIQLMEKVRIDFETRSTPIALSGCIGPRGDGYAPGARMSADEAEQYHSGQIEVLADTACDLVSAFTINYAAEAIGIAQAARKADLPVVISFTVETDGRLPDGKSLGETIQMVDDATSGHPAYYMINCSHPEHILAGVRQGGAWLRRLRGLRVNASRKSHAELDNSPVLDAGDPAELGAACADLLAGPLSHVNILGGCCGTDHRHVEQIAEACFVGQASRRAAG